MVGVQNVEMEYPFKMAKADEPLSASPTFNQNISAIDTFAGELETACLGRTAGVGY